MARSCKAEALGRLCCGVRREGPREWMRICVGHNLLMHFRSVARMSCQVEAKGHWDHQRDAPDRGHWDFQETIHLCRSSPRKNCTRRVIPANQRSYLVNSQK